MSHNCPQLKCFLSSCSLYMMTYITFPDKICRDKCYTPSFLQINEQQACKCQIEIASQNLNDECHRKMLLPCMYNRFDLA